MNAPRVRPRHPGETEAMRQAGARLAIGLLIACSFLDDAASAAGAPPDDPKQDAFGDPPGDTDEDPDNNDLTRPQSGFDVRFRYQSSSGTSSRTDQEITMLRLTNRFTLDTDWKLATIAQLPIVTKTTTDTDRESGIGDPFLQAALIRTIDEDWAFGFGARLVAPTPEDNLGSGKWQIMPGFGVRYSLPALGPDSYFVPAIRYAVSFAGDPSRRNISQPQIAPTLNIGLPDRWYVTLYPSYDIRINYGDPVSGQKGRLFLPFDGGIGRRLSDNLTMFLEVGVPIIKDYPVYDFKIEARLAVKF
jgi:Putative MetA-pathway of phenol degradation